MFSMSVFLVGVPKTVFGFRDVECLIIGMAELLSQEEFYGLDIRNNLGHYSVFATFMIMLAYNSALVGGVKLTTIVNLAGSFQVAEAVYEANWENETTAVQTDLQLVMVRAQKPVGITAGKFSYMNFELFGNVVRTTYSTFLVLKDVL
ncbi:odorant receptor 30a-like [Anopheles cruzii]|uniref:odorant receptor 30a-like n=1 Tax=Anopheles cruzii TaxID=68878 RepID=UPI0022EC4804|nr:odorant receptor 30a-like [Anopheles cruzii]